MSKQIKTNELIKEIKSLDSLKAVNVAMELDKQQGLTISKIINLMIGMDQNMKLLATKVLELEKKVESLEGYANREL